MGRVAGGSKACLTCIRRKKGCDEERPSCARCRKAGLTCEGYVRPHTFVVTTSGGGSSSRKKASPPRGQRQHQRRSLSDGHPGESSQQPSQPQGSSNEVVGDTFFNDSLEPLLLIGAGACAGITLAPTVHYDITLARTFARSAAEIQILDGLWSAYFPGGQFPSACPPAVTNGSPIGGLIYTLQTLYPEGDQLLKDSVLAMALTTAGVCHNDVFLQREGLKMYGRSLQRLGSALADPKRREGMQLLPVVRTFSFYESLYGSSTQGDHETQGRNWMAHSGGDLALMVANPPSFYVTGHAHALFVHGRLHQTIHCLKSRKHLFLSEPDWKTIPWSVHPKEPRDHVLDILVDIPGMLEYADRVRAWKACLPNVDPHNEGRERLIVQCIDMWDRLQAWEARYGKKEAVLATAAAFVEEQERQQNTSASASDSQKAHLPNDGVSPTDLTTAHTMAIFWATSLLLCSIFHSLRPDPSRIPAAVDPEAFSLNIARTVPLFLRDEIGLFRIHLTSFPLGACMTYLEMSPRDVAIPTRRLLAKYFRMPECAGILKLIVSLEHQDRGLVALRQKQYLETLVDIDDGLWQVGGSGIHKMALQELSSV